MMLFFRFMFASCDAALRSTFFTIRSVSLVYRREIARCSVLFEKSENWKNFKNVYQNWFLHPEWGVASLPER